MKKLNGFVKKRLVEDLKNVYKDIVNDESVDTHIRDKYLDMIKGLGSKDLTLEELIEKELEIVSIQELGEFINECTEEFLIIKYGGVE